MTGLREQKKSRVRTAIYEAAVSLFETDGYDAVSVERIAARAGIAKGTFFNHFASKADILSAWHEASSLAEGEDAAGAMTDNLRDALLRPALAAVRFAQTYPALWAATIRETPSTPSLRRLEAQSDERLRQRYEEAFREAIASRMIKAQGDPQTLAALAVTLLTGCVREWIVLESRPLSLNAHLTRTLDNYLHVLGYTPYDGRG
ncbi:TetR/AcrR family transcriptional regulator [Synechococcus moorigangaii CMS01]|jgi:AcrR family transcriptional regulator|nr:TetR/AcrR family transcriptional regulator [Synechococcus moorigangaii CMS01]